MKVVGKVAVVQVVNPHRASAGRGQHGVGTKGQCRQLWLIHDISRTSPAWAMPSSAEKSRTQVPFQGATATVLPSGLMATSGQTERGEDPELEPERAEGPCAARDRIGQPGQRGGSARPGGPGPRD